MKKNIGIIGTGNMGVALLNGFIASNVVPKENIHAYDVSKEKLAIVENELEIITKPTVSELTADSEIVFVAVKPQNIVEVLGEVTNKLASSEIEKKLFISVLAGTPMETFKNKLGENTKIIRLMPNTPSLVNAGMIGLSKNNKVTEEEKDFVKKLLEPTGEILEIEEKYLDAVTAISGSGPAYIFMVIQSMVNAGIKIGLSQEQSLKLAAQTTYGAAKLVLEKGEHPEVLKDRVSSPAGTTIYGLHELENGGLRGTIIKGIERCHQRAQELKDFNN